MSEHHLLGHDNALILKRVCGWLELDEVQQLSLASRSCRKIIVNHKPLWTDLMKQRYPNLFDVGGVSCWSHHDYLMRLRMHRDPVFPVRPAALPEELLLPGEFLLRTWQPEAICFYIDLWRGSTRMISTTHRVKLDEKGEPVFTFNSNDELHKAEPCFIGYDGNREFVHPNLSGDDNFLRLGGPREIQLCGDDAIEQAEAIASELHSFGEYEEINVKMYASLSYKVEGEDVPSMDKPVMLLSEHESFHGDNTEYGMPVRLLFRTDVMDTYEWSDNYLPDRYVGSPLPFDPVIDLFFSPRGERWNQFPNWDGVICDRMKNDTVDVCSLYLELRFYTASRFPLDFSGIVLSRLLSLYHEVIRRVEEV